MAIRLSAASLRLLAIVLLGVVLLALVVIGYRYLYPEPTWSQVALRPAPSSCGCVAFRLDDIQDFFTREAQIDVIKMFLEEAVPLTVAVIGGSLHDDGELIQFLRDATSAGVEVANHGWIHSDHTAMSPEEQRESIARTNDRIKTLFGVDARTFIPPENPFNQETLAAMREVGLTHLSGSLFLKADPPPYPLKNGDRVFHLPQTAFVNNLGQGVWRTFPAERVLEMVRFSISEFGFAVVVMHPVGFYDRTDAGYVYHRLLLEPLRELLRAVKREFKVVPLGEIDRAEWLPGHVPRDLRLREYTVSWAGTLVPIASSAKVEAEVRGERLVARRVGGEWGRPFLLLVPDAIVPRGPLLAAEGEPLPILRWFNPQSRMWIVYADPPPSATSLEVRSR